MDFSLGRLKQTINRSTISELGYNIDFIKQFNLLALMASEFTIWKTVSNCYALHFGYYAKIVTLTSDQIKEGLVILGRCTER